jgi:hypothetical protein
MPGIVSGAAERIREYESSPIIHTYSELCLLDTLEDRFEYLKLKGTVGEELFGYARYLNQQFYHSPEWLDAKERVVIRDQGYDLGVPGWKISGTIYVHHMNPITLKQLKENDPALVDPEFLISCSYNTHQAITWGNKSLLPQPLIIRRPGDTCPWK